MYWRIEFLLLLFISFSGGNQFKGLLLYCAGTIALFSNVRAVSNWQLSHLFVRGRALM